MSRMSSYSLRQYGYVGGVCWQGLWFEVPEYIEENALIYYKNEKLLAKENVYAN